MKKRTFMLILGVFSMLFAGIIYAWSILKVPLADGIDKSVLSLNYTLTMCFFCVGGLAGSLLNKRLGLKLSVIVAGLVAGLGFIFTGLFTTDNALLLYLTYALMAGGGIGIVYNLIISSVNAWFTDKKGLCSGCLMMGFGSSTLILGNLASILFDLPIGWRSTYVILGVALGISLTLTGLLLQRPTAEDALPEAKTAATAKESFEQVDLSPKEMLKRFSFWRAFILLV